MRALTTAVWTSAGAVAACGHGVTDPAGRPRNAKHYNAQMDAWEAASAAGTATFEQIPMLTREQKERAICEDFCEQADESDSNGKPETSHEKLREVKESFVAYYNAPFGTVEEREAWGRYMRAVNE